MAASLWGVRRRRRPIPPGFADRKRSAFFRAAIQRYAWEDYERVPVRTLAGYAGVSVATFYDRFGSQRAFWYAVVGAQFQGATRAMIDQIDQKTWDQDDPRTIVRRIVEHIVTGMNGGTIGITRMAIRLAMTAPKAAEPFLVYREAITERAIKLLAPKIKLPRPEEAVRQAIRMILAIASETSWLHNGPLLGHERALMTKQLSRLTFRSLGLRRLRSKRLINKIESDQSERTMIASFQQAIQKDLPIYSIDLKAYEKAVKESRKPKIKLSGPFIDPNDAFVLALRDQEPRSPKKRVPKSRGRRFKLI